MYLSNILSISVSGTKKCIRQSLKLKYGIKPCFDSILYEEFITTTDKKLIRFCKTMSRNMNQVFFQST